MEVKKVNVERGWGWLQDGWELFMKNPGVWILMALIYVFIMFVLSYVPLLGILASGLLGTMLSGGLIYGAAKLDGGGTLEIAHLFQAFRDPTRTGPMLILGCISLAGNLLVAVLNKAFIAVPLVGMGIMGYGNAMQFSAAALLGLLLVLLATAFVALLLFYAIPLVMLENVEPLQAVKDGVMGCLHNWLPLLVLGLILTLLTVLAMLPFGLGLLILGPVMVGAWYRSYKELYVG
jgi:uncharacterized membrane protein